MKTYYVVGIDSNDRIQAAVSMDDEVCEFTSYSDALAEANEINSTDYCMDLFYRPMSSEDITRARLNKECGL